MMKRTGLQVTIPHVKRPIGLVLISVMFIITLPLLGVALQYKEASAVTQRFLVTGSNPITTENQQPGSTGWQFDFDSVGAPLKATNHEIEGYASLTSVNKGSQISFMVSLSSSAQYKMDVYRMGYYLNGTNRDGSACAGPCGGRLMQGIGPLNGGKQAACPTTTTTVNFGLIECQWSISYTLTVPTSWTTGNYIVKLTRLDTGLENYMTFVVRDDAGPADLVLSMDVTTWQAYNFWGGAGNGNVGYSLYGNFNDVTFATLSNSKASTVSFDRPYMVQGAQDGAGNFMVWDYPMVRWLEAQGYNVTYATDIDLETNANLLNGRKALLNTGHDEYYSDNMRSNVQSYINAGKHMGFFSANNIYYRIEWANSVSGQAYRREVCYKQANTIAPNTLRWRDLTPAQPENAIVGVLQNGVASNRPYLVYNASSWIYAGTGLVNYNGGTIVTSGVGQNAIDGLVGYEFDERAANDSNLSAFVANEPAGLEQVGHSFVPASDNGVDAYSDATLYTAASGAIVFAAGTIQWSWGLDNGFNDGYCDCNPGYVNTASQQITSNILNRFISSSGTDSTPTPTSTSTTGLGVSLNPTSVNFGNQTAGISSTAQTITLTNTGGSSLTISQIAVRGTNASDFAQSNTCPTSLAANGTCTISVAFTPTATGTRSASVAITDNAAGSPQTVALSGSGTSSTGSTTYFSDDFESGNLSKWTTPGVNGSVSVESSVVHSGSYALAITNMSRQFGYVYTSLQGGAQTQTYTSFSFRVTNITSSTPIVYTKDANGNKLWEVDYDATGHGIDIYFWNGARTRYAMYSNANAINANTWYNVEVQSNEVTAGHGEVWLNGTSIGAINTDLSVTQGISQLVLDDEAAGTVYFDDIKVANTY